MSNMRIKYIDIAKGFLILMVLYGHLYKIGSIKFQEIETIVPLYYRIREWIYTFHMPAFFVITGLLLKREDYLTFSFLNILKKKLKSLLLPYVLFEMLAAGTQMLIYGTDYININGAIYNLVTLKNPTIVNWFLLALFVAEIITWFIIRKACSLFKTLFVLVSMLLPSLMDMSNYYIVFICRILIASSFIIIGNSFQNRIEIITKSKFIVVYFIVSIICTIFSNSIDLYYCQLGNPLIYLIGSLAGTLLVLCISKMKTPLLIDYLGRNTLIILGTHQLIINIISQYISVDLSYSTILIAFLIIVMLELLIIKLYDLNKYIIRTGRYLHDKTQV